MRRCASDPHAFGSTYEREPAQARGVVGRRGRQLSDAGDEQRTFVAVDDEDRWLGMALVRRNDAPGRPC